MPVSNQSSLFFYDINTVLEDTQKEVTLGLQRPQKMISPKFFYDEMGSKLFMEITRQPEYYLTRTEISLLSEYADEMAGLMGENCLLIEYGSGSSEKIRILLESLRPRAYAPLDISKEYLAAAAGALASEFPWLEVHATCLDFTEDFELPFTMDARRVAFFPGSSIGNFSRTEARAFLGRARRLVGDEGGMLIGVDLKKDIAVLNAAYNDSNGITEKFNLHVLTHLNERFDADFDLKNFAHSAVYESEKGCVAMYLTSLAAQNVQIAGTSISFEAGEKIHTENSHKYAKEEFLDMALDAGFTQHRFWTDINNRFGIFYLT
jgi:dimethylhistidine N-methyltransferase|tara:strand:- start:973 stop:1932 length:960 start_codon:yes stop_codon:yes gene_type:complete